MRRGQHPHAGADQPSENPRQFGLSGRMEMRFGLLDNQRVAHARVADCCRRP